MIKTLLLGLSTYVITAFLGYVVHWAIHQKWAGRAYRAHRAHHVELYPPGKLISDAYLSAGSQSTVFTFLALFTPVLMAPFVLWIYGELTFIQACVMLFTMSFVGLANDLIHDSFHIRDHWLSRYVPGYNKMRQMHFVHHINMKKNFGIYSFVCDALFGTFRKG